MSMSIRFFIVARITIAISESTEVYKSIKQNYNNVPGKDLRKRNVFRHQLKIGKDGDDCTSGGREFHVIAAATGNDWRLTVDNHRCSW